MNFYRLINLLKQNAYFGYAVVYIFSVASTFAIFLLLQKRPKIETSTSVQIESHAMENSLKDIVVEISGAVTHPGVYKLDEEARVNDLLALAGGFAEEADALWIARNLNLSRKIQDAEKIYIPFLWDIEGASQDLAVLPLKIFQSVENTKTSPYSVSNGQTSQEVEVASSNLINVNTASVDDLDSLTGIGPAYAEKIILNRPYIDFADLIAKATIPQSTLEKNKSSITF